jgi:serine/threonine-protein kinase
MSLKPGSTLGDYEIKSLIGVGSMGEVYRGRDRVLKREIAVKVLPEEFARDEERLSRFEREARLLASLNHANIGAIHGVGRVDDTRFLVLELVDGETLQETFRRGPLPMSRALPLFVQLAEALEAAHQKGVIHRDLKPANVKITADGRVKVLDFGVAKCLRPESILDPSANTGTDDSSVSGMVVGSAGYMSPEQARGMSIDERADIWAFGCVLFEALTGTRAFRGRTVAETLAIVLEHEPKWHLIPAHTPARLEELVRRCLRKDPRRRLHDIADVRIELEDVQLPTTRTEQDEEEVPSPRRPWKAAALALAALLLGLLAGTAWERRSSESARSQSRESVARFAVELPPDRYLPYESTSSLALAPDGSRLVFSVADAEGRTRLYQRELDELGFSSLPATVGSYDPFFSPDGRWFGYFIADSGKFLLKRLSFEGGAAVAFHEESSRPEGGAAWGEDDNIVFAASDGLYSIAANGGVRRPLIPAPAGEGEVRRWPEILPGGKALLFTAWMPGNPAPSIVAQSIDSGRRSTLVEKGTYARYSSAGQIVFAWEGAIYAAPLDLEELRLTTPPVRLVDEVQMDPESGVAQFAISRNGILAYVPGRAGDRRRRLLKLDAEGDVSWESGQGAAVTGPFRISPDGSIVALAQAREDDVDIWLFDLETGVLRQLTDGGTDRAPLWSPEGDELIYRSERSGPAALFLQDVAGLEPARRLTHRDDDPTPTSWAGASVAFTARNELTGLDIWRLDLETGDSELLRGTGANETEAAYSPDGKWIAYASDATGRYEVYVSASVSPLIPSPVSEGGGDTPRWAQDGGRLYYRRGRDLVAVDVEGGASPRAGLSSVVWSLDYDAPFEVLPGGGGFLLAEKAVLSNRIIVLLNLSGMLDRAAASRPAGNGS